jgi:hypothetical protein
VRRAVYILVAACSGPVNSKPQIAAPAPTAPTPPTGSTQNCDIAVHDDSFVVDGERITPQGSGTVAQLVLRDGGTLVAATHQLWRVDCKRTPHVQQLIASPTAAVPTGHLAPDGHTFIYASGDGIAALDLTALVTRAIYKTPADEPPNPCAMLAMAGSGRAQPHASDDLRGFADGGRTLIVERRWGCHYPDAYEYRLVDWADPTKAKLHPARPIYAIAVDPKGTLFIGDSGGLWRSTDRGNTWKPVPIKGNKGAVVDVFADAKRSGQLVIRTAIGTEVAEGLRSSDFHGPAFRTRDGGATWQKVMPPAHSQNPDEIEQIYAAYMYSLVVVDGNVDHVLVETGMPDDTDAAPEDNNEAPPEGEEGPVIQRVDQGADGFQLAEPPRPAAGGWRATKDGGKTWTQVAAPPPRSRTVTSRGDTFEATGDGLYRTRAGKRELVTPPLAKPYYNDAY